MKRLLIAGLLAAGLAVSAVASADDCGDLQPLVGMQLNPPLKDAFMQVGTGISIAGRDFVVAEPTRKIGDYYIATLDHLCSAPSGMVIYVTHKHGCQQITKAVAMPKHEKVQLMYAVNPYVKNTALDVIDIKRGYDWW